MRVEGCLILARVAIYGNPPVSTFGAATPFLKGDFGKLDKKGSF